MNSFSSFQVNIQLSFLKITVCGFREIGVAKKLKFNSEEKQNINEIDSNSTYILGKNIDSYSLCLSTLNFLAFSTIFDAKFDFSDFVQTNQEKSYVEVVLLQRGKNAFFGYKWVSRSTFHKNKSAIKLNSASFVMTDCASSEI